MAANNVLNALRLGMIFNSALKPNSVSINCRNDLKPVENINVKMLSGRWYLTLKNYKQTKLPRTCIKADYITYDNKSFDYVLSLKIAEKLHIVKGKSEPDPKNLGHRIAHAEYNNRQLPLLTYKFLSVDYKSHIIVSRCGEVNKNKNDDLIEIYTREQFPTVPVAKKLKAAFRTIPGLFKFYPSSQKKCK